MKGKERTKVCSVGWHARALVPNWWEVWAYKAKRKGQRSKRERSAQEVRGITIKGVKERQCPTKSQPLERRSGPILRIKMQRENGRNLDCMSLSPFNQLIASLDIGEIPGARDWCKILCATGHLQWISEI